MAEKWNPETHPYRVSWLRVGSGFYHGWATSSRTFETLEDAKAAATERFDPGVKSADIDVVDGWPGQWKWKQLGSRKRCKDLQLEGQS